MSSKIEIFILVFFGYFFRLEHSFENITKKGTISFGDGLFLFFIIAKEDAFASSKNLI